MDIFNIIKDLAAIPAFTEHEEIIHPYIREFAVKYFPPDTEIIEIKKSLFIKIPGNPLRSPVALSANIDKCEAKIKDFLETESEITGNLDNSVGLGFCLYLAHRYCIQDERPPIYLFLTELGDYGNIGAFHFKLFLTNIETNTSCHG